MELKGLFKKKSSRKQTAKNVAIGAGIGTAVGVAAGVLLAPKSGKETREDIANTTKQTLENVKEGLNVAKEKIEELVKKIKAAAVVKLILLKIANVKKINKLNKKLSIRKEIAYVYYSRP